MPDITSSDLSGDHAIRVAAQTLSVDVLLSHGREKMNLLRVLGLERSFFKPSFLYSHQK